MVRLRVNSKVVNQNNNYIISICLRTYNSFRAFIFNYTVVQLYINQRVNIISNE